MLSTGIEPDDDEELDDAEWAEQNRELQSSDVMVGDEIDVVDGDEEVVAPVFENGRPISVAAKRQMQDAASFVEYWDHSLFKAGGHGLGAWRRRAKVFAILA